MSSLILYLGFMFIGYILSSSLHFSPEKFRFIPNAMMLTVYILLFLMGIRMGINKQITSNLDTIGLQALIITIFCLAGSIIGVYAARKIWKYNHCGIPAHKSGEKQSAESPKDKKENPSQLKSTLTILLLVAGGMLIGHFIIMQHAAHRIPAIYEISGTLLQLLLCFIVFVVGFDLGLSGNVAASIKTAGVRILVFPLAAIAGTLLFGAAAGLLLGLSVKEGLVISAGFGWYSYAPTVISAAGEEYIIISAIAFMQNVIRETLGIILIPVVARKIGYIEAAALPGVSATDICIPIIERSCSQDTVIYSFLIGLSMCIAASVLVPLLMNI